MFGFGWDGNFPMEERTESISQVLYVFSVRCALIPDICLTALHGAVEDPRRQQQVA
jgi:hypothetical protein